MIRSSLATALCLCALATVMAMPQAGKPVPLPKLYPVDESPKDPAFLAFRKQLEAVVKARDKEALLRGRFLYPNLQLRLRNADLTEFWGEMADIFRLGLAVDPAGELVGPYFIAKFPRKLWDPPKGSLYMVIVGRDIAAHEKPSEDSRVIETLTYDIVRKLMSRNSSLDVTAKDKQGYSWYAIRTPRGQPGWVYGRDARDPCDDSALFGRNPDGSWSLVELGSSCD
jgi:hypothetical protein